MKKNPSAGGERAGARKHPARASTQPAAPAAPPPGETSRATWLEPIPPPALLQRISFHYVDPDAHEVQVVGTFNGWNPAASPMLRDASGRWSLKVELPSGEYRYRFMVDGEWRDDPAATRTAPNAFGGFDAIVSVA